jgi:hypothetical protein
LRHFDSCKLAIEFVGHNLNACRIIEFGFGENTLLFLNKNIFPKLSTLISFETNKNQIDIIEKRVPSNEKYKWLKFISNNTNKLVNYAKVYSPVDCLLINEKPIGYKSKLFQVAHEISNIIILCGTHDKPEEFISKFRYKVNFGTSNDWSVVVSNIINISIWS